MSIPINDGGPAFPHAQRLWDNDTQSWAVHSVGGMTLRDYFAGQALAGVLSSGDVEIKTIVSNKLAAASFTQSCYIIADAMLAAREAKL